MYLLRAEYTLFLKSSSLIVCYLCTFLSVNILGIWTSLYIHGPVVHASISPNNICPSIIASYASYNKSMLIFHYLFINQNVLLRFFFSFGYLAVAIESKKKKQIKNRATQSASSTFSDSSTSESNGNQSNMPSLAHRIAPHLWLIM